MHDADNARDPIFLSEREWEVVRHVSRGASNDEIAEALRVSAATVHLHLQHIFTKLGLDGKEQLAAWHDPSERPDAPPDQV